MRRAFVETLTELAGRDERILLLTADLGYQALEPFAEKHPGRFFNVGVAEQNMVGLATGLAEAGFVPFVYSITPFAVLRPYEFIRNGPIQHRLPVRIVGVGGGLEYGTNGLSHYGLEDVAVMRTQPGITIIAPADGQQTRRAVAATWDLPGPIYYRLGKDDKAVVPGLEGRFEVGKIQRLKEGTDLLLIAMGSVATEAAAAAAELAARGVNCSLVIVAQVSPAPMDELADLLGRHAVALTVEAHYRVGGVGSLVAEVIAERGLDCRLVRCGVGSLPSGITGSQRYLHHLYGISAEKLVETAVEAVRGKPSRSTCRVLEPGTD
jgi:transketolase